MTDDERITQLDERVTRIEDDMWSRLDSIDAKLTALTVSFAGRSQCPAPGKCLQLDTALGSAVLRIERLELRMIDYDRWKEAVDAWRFRIIGGLAVLLCALTLFGPAIRKVLHLE